MVRPKTVAEPVVLEAALALMTNEGPDALTFAALAKAVGLSPATLVQRHGSRAALVRAALIHAWDTLDARTAAADADAPQTPEGAISLLTALSPAGSDANDHAGGLLLLREDFRDPALRARGVAWGRMLARALGRRLTPDPLRQDTLGRLMASQWQGALIWWGFSRESDPADVIAGQLRVWCETVLERERQRL